MSKHKASCPKGPYWASESAKDLGIVSFKNPEKECDCFIDWYQEYEYLRTMHAYLKLLKNELVAGIPHFAGDQKELPRKYKCLLENIDSALYSAEKYVSKRMY